MAGCSITLLKLDDQLTRLWDAPVLTLLALGDRNMSVSTEDVLRWISASRRR